MSNADLRLQWVECRAPSLKSRQYNTGSLSGAGYLHQSRRDLAQRARHGRPHSTSSPAVSRATHFVVVAARSVVYGNEAARAWRLAHRLRPPRHRLERRFIPRLSPHRDRRSSAARKPSAMRSRKPPPEIDGAALAKSYMHIYFRTDPAAAVAQARARGAKRTDVELLSRLLATAWRRAVRPEH